MRNQSGNDDINDNIMENINQSLARQVQEEMDERPRKTTTSKKRRKKRGKRLRIIFRIVLFLLVVTIGVGSFLIFTKPGRNILVHFATEYAYSKLDFKGEEPEEPILDENGTVITPNINPYQMSETFRNARHEEGVINILLLGLEAIGYGESKSNGHTDSIMIATMNINTGSFKLTSLMRDSWVTIPGYGDQRINTAYAKGGINTMYETIAYNYDLQLDGHALVGFNDFEQIIDTLGGIEIELTEQEASYLNSTNYISNKAYRTVVPGKQTLNGNQALGYCRVRKIPTLDGSNNDMGRTSRHRRVINAIFDKVKTSSITDLISVANKILPLVETDIRKNNCKAYLANAIEIGIKDMNLETLRLPEDGGYTAEKINGAQVLVPIWDKTVESLHQFIFEPKPETTPQTPEGTEGNETQGISGTDAP